MVETSFKVLIPIEPMSGSRGKRRYERKRQLIEAVTKAKGTELAPARHFLAGQKVKVSVRFNLQKPAGGQPESLDKKDLDNMLKLVLDSLQQYADAQHKLEGLGLIRNDGDVYRIEAVKRIVDRPEQAGITLTVSKFHPSTVS